MYLTIRIYYFTINLNCPDDCFLIFFLPKLALAHVDMRLQLALARVTRLLLALARVTRLLLALARVTLLLALARVTRLQLALARVTLLLALARVTTRAYSSLAPLSHSDTRRML